MENLLYIAAIVAAIAFLILCVSLAMTVLSLKTTLKGISETMNGLSTQLEGVTTETTALLHKTNALADDIQQKSAKLNSVVEAVVGVGSTVTNLNNSVQRVSSSLVHEAEKNSEKVSQVLQWSSVAIGIWNKVKESSPKSSGGWTVYAPESNQKNNA